MNAFNRAFMVLLALVLACGGLFVFLIVSGLLSDTSSTAPEYIRAYQYIKGYSESAAPMWLTGSLSAAVFGFVLFILELPLRKPRAKLLTLRNDAAGSVTVSLNGLRRLSEHVIGAIPGVERVETDARADIKGLSLDCRLQLAPDTSAPTLAAEVRESVSNAMEQHIGRAPVRVDIHTQVGQPAGIRRRVR
jgi:hypothetical protein